MDTAHAADFLSHRPRIPDDATCPFKHPFVFGGQSVKTRASVDQQYAETFFKLPDAR
jgi:hypothetical protein